MNKEEFIEMRNKYSNDLECIKGEKINKNQFYEWKVQFGLSKRGKAHKELREKLLNMSKEEFMKIRSQYNSNEECAKALNLGKDDFYRIKKQLGLNQEYDHSEINYDDFIKLYEQGLNDAEIAESLNTNSKRIAAFRKKYNLKNNVDKELTFTDEQYQIFLGGMLGDSCLMKPKDCKNAFFTFTHSLKQEGYAKWKWEKLKNLCFEPFYGQEHDSRNSNVYHNVKVVSFTNKLFTPFLSKFYNEQNGKRIKYINKDLLYTINDLGIAIWFMDDGYKETCGYCLSTNCFTKEDIDIIIEFFKERYNIIPKMHKNHVLYFGAKYKDAFTNIIKPFIHSDCLYKLH